MVNVACDVERSHLSGAGATPMAPVQATHDNELARVLAELQALKQMQRSAQSGNNTNRFGLTQQQRQPQSPGTQTGTRGPPGQDPVKRVNLNARIQKANTWRFCTKCRQWGKHLHNECRANKSRIATLAPMDPSTPPPDSQPLSDWFWDTQPITPPPPGN